MKHAVNYGESPATIARRYGVSTMSLLQSNPLKPTKIVNGQRTWHSVGIGEQVHVPLGVGYLGDIVSDAVSALNAAGGPCAQKNAGIVCAIQATLGLTQDGKYGPGTAAAAKKLAPTAPPACSPAPAWWGKKGESKCAGVSIPSFPSAPSAGLPISIPGLPPILNLPPLPTIPGPIPAMPVSFPSAAALPAIAGAVAALASADPCYSGNAVMVCAAQAALGLTQDGKYGNDTAAALKRVLGSAPPPCSPAPLWWGKKGESKCGGVLPSLPPIALPSPVQQFPAPTPVFATPDPVYTPPPVYAPPPVQASPIPFPTAPQTPVYTPPAAGVPVYTPPGVAPSPQPIVTAPEQKPGLSTAAMVGIGVGGLALVGLVALAATSKRSTSVTRTSTVRRAPARRASKPSKASKSKHPKKGK